MAFHFYFYLYKMGNTYFQFKEFRIDQDRCAMKVCTDSCLFGAWIPVRENDRAILDIGTGTGLLALIMAQRTAAQIDAVELEPEAYGQALENAARSKWSDRIRVHLTDISGFNPGKTYDLVVCNPPFYEHDLESVNPEEKFAKHGVGLTLDKLFQSIQKLTNQDTRLALLLPYFRKQATIKIAAGHGWYPAQELHVRNRAGDPCFRYLVVLTKKEVTNAEINEMTIYQDQKTYTEPFTVLLSTLYF
jgi:tRNA1Val (adenine37-N6)-methyltransferase